MNEKIEELLADLKPEAIDAYPLTQESHPVPVIRELEGLRRWAGVRADGVSAVPRELLDVLLSRGQEGLVRLYETFSIETLRTDSEALALWEALAILTRRAKGMKVISWSLDGIKPEAARGKARLLIVLERELDERLRSVALARNETISGFISDSVRARLSSIEGRRHPARGKVEAARKETTEKAAATA